MAKHERPAKSTTARANAASRTQKPTGTRKTARRGRQTDRHDPTTEKASPAGAAAKSVKTKAHQKAFLAAFVRTGTVYAAALGARIHRDTHYTWLKTDPDYALAFQVAEEDAVQLLETELRKRALHGTERPIFYKGEQVGSYQEHDTTAAIFILKARRPEIYRERFEGTMKSDIDLTEATDEEIAVVKALLQRQALKKAARV